MMTATREEIEAELAAAREEADRWRQIAEATELTKQGLEQDIETAREKPAAYWMMRCKGSEERIARAEAELTAAREENSILAHINEDHCRALARLEAELAEAREKANLELSVARGWLEVWKDRALEAEAELAAAREALEEIAGELEEAPCGPSDPWVVRCQFIARAALATDQPTPSAREGDDG